MLPPPPPPSDHPLSRKKHRLKGHGYSRANEAPGSPFLGDTSGTDVKQMLRENTNREEFFGRFRVKRAPKRGSRRFWDFLMVLFVGNGVGVGLFWYLPQNNAGTMLMIAAGMLFYTIVVSWLMFVSHDDY
jgi:hypothetical protein